MNNIDKIVVLEDGVLVCPNMNCRCSYLHQVAVDVHFREEDSDEGLRMLAHKDNLSDYLVSGDTSLAHGRRDSLMISFQCENCNDGEEYHLMIWQHKGSTIMEWKQGR